MRRSANSFLPEEVLGLVSLGLFSLLGSCKFRSLLVELHKLGEIEFGLLQELELSNEDVLEREDFSAFLLDLLAKSLRSAKDIININGRTYNFLTSSL